MSACCGIALAGEGSQAVDVANAEPSSSSVNDASFLQITDNAAEIAAPHAQHRRELLLRQRQIRGAGALDRSKQPFRRALFDRMRCIAGDRLKHLVVFEKLAFNRADILPVDAIGKLGYRVARLGPSGLTAPRTTCGNTDIERGLSPLVAYAHICNVDSTDVPSRLPE